MMRAVAAVLLAARACSFNVDTQYPLVWPDRQRGSYFGYTVALRDVGGDPRLVVGAPRGNNTYRAYNTWSEPGAVYQCRLRYPTCEQLPLDYYDANYVDHPSKGYKYENKNDYAWLGGTISVQHSQNKPMVVCAPRWKNTYFPGHYLMQGMCYFMTEDFTPESQFLKLYPLNDHRRLSYLASSNPGQKQLEKPFYAYGEAGLSAHLTEDGSELLIGAPGVFDWAGTVIVYRNITTDLEDILIPNPFRTPSKQGPYHYFGYAVSSGKFFRGSGTLYVTSAPRAGQLRGKVFIFSLPPSVGQPLDIWTEKVGDQLGEYFGASLCVVDLNKDGLDDLLVGAPRHTLNERGKVASDEGRLYVFLSQDQGRLKEVSNQGKIVGDGVLGANFGTSIASLGDINNDGYPDIAVGAPYVGEERSGAVYIYHGDRQGIKTKYSQRIFGFDIDRSIRGFGISISNGIDIDNNGYNDVAVGAYLSGHATVLRTKSVIAVRAKLIADVDRISTSASSFQVASCISYTGEDVPDSIDVHSIMEVDPVLTRATISSEPHNSSKHDEDVVVFSSNPNCKNFTMSLKEGQRDVSKPIEIKLDYTLQDNLNIQARRKRGSYEGFCKNCPVLDPDQPKSITLRVPYENGCGEDGVCHTDLRLQAKLISDTTPLVLGNRTTVVIHVSVENLLDPAFQSRVVIESSQSLSITKMTQTCHKNSAHSVLHIDCDLGDPLMSRDGSRSITVELDVNGIPGYIKEILFSVTARSAGFEETPADNTKILALEIRTHSDIKITGSEESIIVKKSRRKSFNEDVQACVFVAAVMMGVLVFLMMVLVLLKFGFFRRSKIEDFEYFENKTELLYDDAYAANDNSAM